MVLRQEYDGLIRAVIMRKPTFRNKVYQVLSPKPMFRHQQTVIHHHDFDGPLYLWAKIQQCPHSLRFEMVLESAYPQKDEVRYVSDYCGPILSRKAKLRIAKSTTTTNGKPQTCAFFQQESSPRKEWSVFVGPGVCPLLMLCFAAVIPLY